MTLLMELSAHSLPCFLRMWTLKSIVLDCYLPWCSTAFSHRWIMRSQDGSNMGELCRARGAVGIGYPTKKGIFWTEPDSGSTQRMRLTRGILQPRSISYHGTWLFPPSVTYLAPCMEAWGDCSFIHCSSAFHLPRDLRVVTYSRWHPSSNVREKVSLTHTELRLGDLCAAQREKKKFPYLFHSHSFYDLTQRVLQILLVLKRIN